MQCFWLPRRAFKEFPVLLKRRVDQDWRAGHTRRGGGAANRLGGFSSAPLMAPTSLHRTITPSNTVSSRHKRRVNNVFLKIFHQTGKQTRPVGRQPRDHCRFLPVCHWRVYAHFLFYNSVAWTQCLSNECKKWSLLWAGQLFSTKLPSVNPVLFLPRRFTVFYSWVQM